MDTLDVRQAAGLLHLNVKRVQNLARQGKLPAVRVGRKWLFHRDAIDQMLGRSAGRPAPRGLAISARNRLRGVVERVAVDGLMAEVTLRIGDQELVSVITRSSLERLGLHEGMEACAVIKSTEVMIGREGSDA
jgi:molybdopterin-binding protein